MRVGNWIISIAATAAVTACSLCWIASANAASNYIFSGKLWILPLSSLTASFPAPSQTPDATFTTKHISFWSDAPYPSDPIPDATVNNTVKRFLDSANNVSQLVYSNLDNSAVGGEVNANTPTVNSTATSDGSYGICLEIYGTIKLSHDQVIEISHDNDVAVQVDGSSSNVTLNSGVSNAFISYYTFTGSTGSHTIDIIYTNAGGHGLLSVEPAL